MGTNYYIQIDTCDKCGHVRDKLHIGKSSRGWAFMLHVHPKLGLTDLESWTVKLKAFEHNIFDEYGKKVEYNELISTITERYGVGLSRSSLEPYGFRDENGLARFKLGHGCVGHGEGPWDYIDEDFS